MVMDRWRVNSQCWERSRGWSEPDVQSVSVLFSRKNTVWLRAMTKVIVSYLHLTVLCSSCTEALRGTHCFLQTHGHRMVEQMTHNPSLFFDQFWYFKTVTHKTLSLISVSAGVTCQCPSWTRAAALCLCVPSTHTPHGTGSRCSTVRISATLGRQGEVLFQAFGQWLCTIYIL